MQPTSPSKSPRLGRINIMTLTCFLLKDLWRSCIDGLVATVQRSALPPSFQGSLIAALRDADGAPRSAAEEPAAVPANEPVATPELLVDTLAEVFSEPRAARLLAEQAGFPRGDLPAFDTARVFWALVVREIIAGKTQGMAALVAAATVQYPANAVFTRYRSASHEALHGKGRGRPDGS